MNKNSSNAISIGSNYVQIVEYTVGNGFDRIGMGTNLTHNDNGPKVFGYNFTIWPKIDDG